MVTPDNTLETEEELSYRTQLAREAFGMWSDRDPDEYLAHSRAGLALRQRANRAVVVIVENSREGSEVAAPIVRRIIEQYFGGIEGPYAPEWWPPVWWTGDYQELTTPGA